MPRIRHNSQPMNKRKFFKKYKVDNSRKNFKPKAEYDNDMVWIEKLSKLPETVENQISIILTKVGASAGYYQIIRNVVSQIDAIVKLIWFERNYTVHAFGSSITKLALKDSDIDILIDFKGIKVNFGNIPENVAEILNNCIRSNSSFYKVILIPAYVPIIRCIHKNSKTVCEISMSSPMALHNTNLIAFILQLDPRIRPLIIITKFLTSKCPQLPYKFMTSYFLIILIIYFLQQLEEPILPPVSHIQSLAETKNLVDGWNVAFTNDQSLLPKVKNKMTVPELLKDFFKFYSEFDFGFHVISPYMGKTYLVSEFANVDLLPNEYTCYKDKLRGGTDCELLSNNSLFVQDVFDHSRNIKRKRTVEEVTKLQNFCRSSYCILEEMGHHFAKAFLDLFKSATLTKEEDKTERPGGMIYVTSNSNLKCCNLYSEEKLRKYWYKSIFEKWTEILKEIFMCEIVNDKDVLEKSFDISESSIYILCKLPQLGLASKLRMEAKNCFQFPAGMCPITQEKFISSYLVDTVLKNTKIDPIKFGVECYFLKGPTRMKIKFVMVEQNRTKMSQSWNIFGFLQAYLKLLQSVA